VNLSILITGGKETNRDSPSNGEWRENKPKPFKTGSLFLGIGGQL
jgi:hypothetical protein